MYTFFSEAIIQRYGLGTVSEGLLAGPKVALTIEVSKTSCEATLMTLSPEVIGRFML